MTPLLRRDSKSIWCRLGFHSYPLSQGEVGGCTRPNCDHWVQVVNNGRTWTRAVSPPRSDGRPGGLPRRPPAPPPPPPGIGNVARRPPLRVEVVIRDERKHR